MLILFQSTLPHGSDHHAPSISVQVHDFNPRSLTGATTVRRSVVQIAGISIHAHSRERLFCLSTFKLCVVFQSTLPYGSDRRQGWKNLNHQRFQSTLPYGSDRRFHCYLAAIDYFNPRSLTGATANVFTTSGGDLFQSTLPYGSDGTTFASGLEEVISIHAPLRERRIAALSTVRPLPFQSTLPYGSDIISRQSRSTINNFNPRSLTGATTTHPAFQCRYTISIHAPSRERLPLDGALFKLQAFQSTLPHGSDTSSAHRSCDYVYFNPRSLTGATPGHMLLQIRHE